MSDFREFDRAASGRARSPALSGARRGRACSAQLAAPRRPPRRAAAAPRRLMPTSPTSPRRRRWSSRAEVRKQARGRARARARPRARAWRGFTSRRAPRRCSPARAALGESLRYLVDVPLDAKGKPPKLKKQALPAVRRSGRRAGRASCSWSLPTRSCLGRRRPSSSLRTILAALAAPDAPPRGDRGARGDVGRRQPRRRRRRPSCSSTPPTGPPVSLTVDPPARAWQPHWGVSWSEIVDQAAQPARARHARPGTASPASCPTQLPRGANPVRTTAAAPRAGRGRLPLQSLEQLGALPAHPRR